MLLRSASPFFPLANPADGRAVRAPSCSRCRPVRRSVKSAALSGRSDDWRATEARRGSGPGAHAPHRRSSSSRGRPMHADCKNAMEKGERPHIRRSDRRRSDSERASALSPTSVGAAYFCIRSFSPPPPRGLSSVCCSRRTSFVGIGSVGGLAPPPSPSPSALSVSRRWKWQHETASEAASLLSHQCSKSSEGSGGDSRSGEHCLNSKAKVWTLQ